MGKLFDGKLVFTQIPLLLKYLPVTMELAVTAMIASLILGLLLALVKIKKVPVLKQLVSIYISVIRGTPILVQLYVTYFGIPMLPVTFKAVISEKEIVNKEKLMNLLAFNKEDLKLMKQMNYLTIQNMR